MIGFANEQDKTDIIKLMEHCSSRQYHMSTEELITNCLKREHGFIIKDETPYGALTSFLLVSYLNKNSNLISFITDPKIDVSKVAHFKSVAVAPMYRGNKLQVKLLKYGEDVAMYEGYEYVITTVHEFNQISVLNLRSLNYREIYNGPYYGDEKRSVMFKDMMG